jgi:4-hydroxy-2-oxoheptanedioate aldolase
MQRLKQMLDAGNTVIGGWCFIPDPIYVGVVANQEFNAVVLDMQHGFFDETTVRASIATLISAGKSPLVRIPLGRWDTAARVMDFGALGVIAPMINSAADAKLFAAAIRYVPIGERSFGPGYAAGLYKLSVNEYLESIDACSAALVQIETREAYNNLDDILEVDGIDGILIGPGDLSISLRQNRIPDPYGVDSMDVVKDILFRCTQARKKTAVYTEDAETANKLNQLGVDIITVGNDYTYVNAGVASHLSGLDFG